MNDSGQDAPPRILACEDRSEDRYLLETMLKGGGYPVTATPNGREAWEKLMAGESFDLIISDILMPEMDGYQFCTRVKSNERFRGIPFIFLTATYMSQSDQAFALSLGADRFVRKPVDMDDLLAMVADLLAETVKGTYSPKTPLEADIFSKAHVRYLLHGMERKSDELEYLLQKQKDTEAALRESEARYRRISSLASDYFYQLAVTEEGPWAVEWIGGAFEDITGYHPREIKNAEDWLSVLVPADAGEFEGKFPLLLAGQNTEIEYRITTRKGRVRWLKDFNRPIMDDHQRIIGAVGAVHDITVEKEKAEEMLRLVTAVEATPESIMVTDAEGAIEYVNPAFLKNSEYGRDDVLGRTPRILKSGKQSAAVYRNLWETIKKGEIWSGVLVNQKKGGDLYQAETTIAPIRSSSGEITHFVAVRRDVTHERMLERQLRESQKLEAMGTLAGGIAHDFNNILSSTLGFTELSLADLPPDHPIKGNLEEVLTSGNRAKALVQQILLFARRSEKKYGPVMVKLMVKEALKMLRASIPSSVEIRPHMASDSLVLGDPTEVHQVIMNLCTNAVHAMEENGVLSLSLTDEILSSQDLFGLSPDLKPGQFVALQVSDTGCGMGPDIRDRIFEPFFTTKDQGEGTGLGLSVVHGIVKSHGGDIQVTSQPGEGTTFKVYLPVTDAKAALENGREEAIQMGKEHVLAVDDEKSVIKLLRLNLESLGYQVASTLSSEEALEMVEADPARFDLVVTDMTMPRMTGDVLARKILTIRPNMPVILCTGFSNKIDKDKAMGMGIRGFLEKPIRRGTLATMVRRVLDNGG